MGVAAAGFNVLACVELDKHCCDTLKANRSESHQPRVIEGDIRNIDPHDVLSAVSLSPSKLDLLCGGPPCQSFSQIGKQAALNDPRGMLLFEMIKFVEAMRPRALMIEQVKGLRTARGLRGERGDVFEMLLAKLSALGYKTHWKVLNAADYGVPQLRQRLFIVATAEGEHFEFPQPSHWPEGAPALFPDATHSTVAAALADLGDPVLKNGSVPPDSHVDVTPAGDRRRITGVPEGEWLSAQLHLPAAQRGRLSRKDTTKFRRLAWKKPSLTLRCGEIFFHPEQDRYLTPRECLALHGYPEEYVLRGPVRGRSGTVKNLDQHRQVANSVPPPLAEVIARAVRAIL